jgi:maltooligosyltrehalose trehalohydrolase
MDVSKRNIGVYINDDGSADIRVWAPMAQKVEFQLTSTSKRLALEQEPYGYWQLKTTALKEGEHYKFWIDEKSALPDPASLSQPEGVHGASAAVDLKRFEWSDHDWRNLPLDEYILYELHTGTFSEAGDFAGIEQKLDHLKELGVNAIEIMPVAQFPGNRNWGYDGVFPFAVQHSYGGANALMHLVDICHRRGIAVVLDVVYNHLGPEGNYLGAYGPYFTEKYKTPWGGAINFDDEWCDGVREFFIENALMWFRDFHVDALRLDAVHAIKDFSAMHILEEIRIRVDELMKQTGKEHYLIVELDLNDTRFIKPRTEGGFGMDAQWIDEFHHALRVTAGGQRNGYYSDFEGINHLAKAYTDAYVYDGQYSAHRKKKFGVKATGRAGKQFIVFSQNHDQVGNRMLGERTSQLVSFQMQKLLAAAVMVGPFLPMLFMGEEWSEPNPFLYFVSHTDPELVEAVRKGRKEEFASFHLEGEAPDPIAEETFQRSKLSWDVLQTSPHQTMFNYYKALIKLRKSYPVLKEPVRNNLSVQVDSPKNTLTVSRWHKNDYVMILMNFSKEAQTIQPVTEIIKWHKIFDSADPVWQESSASAHQVTISNRSSIVVQPESVLIYSNNHV